MTANQREMILPHRYDNIIHTTVIAQLCIFIFCNPIPHTMAIKEICFYLSLFLTLIVVISRSMRFCFSSLIIPRYCSLYMYSSAFSLPYLEQYIN